MQIAITGKAAPFVTVPNFVHVEVMGQKSEIVIPIGALSDSEIDRLCDDWVARVKANVEKQRRESK